MSIIDSKLPILAGLLLGTAFQAAYGINWQWLEHSPAQSFTEQDWELFRENVRTGLDTLPDAASRDWANPDSGNSGSIKILSSGTGADGHCRTVEISNHTAKGSNHSKSTLCRQEDATWRVRK